MVTTFIQKLVLAAALSSVFVAFPALLRAVENPPVLGIWEDYIIAKKRFQADTARLLSDKWPALASVAALQRDQQFAMIVIRDMKFRYLLANDPSRIVIDRGLSELANFDWSEDDSKALREINPEFAELERWLEEFNVDLSNHRKLGEAQRRFYELTREEVYESMMDRFNERLDELEAALALASRK